MSNTADKAGVIRGKRLSLSTESCAGVLISLQREALAKSNPLENSKLRSSGGEFEDYAQKVKPEF